MSLLYIFDIARHPEDTEDDKLTEVGQDQVNVLIKFLRNTSYDYFASSPYNRCDETLSRIIVEIGIDDSRIIRNLKLCTPAPFEWSKVFLSNQFQDLLPKAGSKYNAALVLAPKLLLIDALYLESALINVCKNLPQNSKVFCISHNTMILAMYHHILYGTLDIKEKANVEHCQIYRFTVSKDGIFNCFILNSDC